MITWRARAYKPCEAASSAVYLTNQAKSGTRRSPAGETRGLMLCFPAGMTGVPQIFLLPAMAIRRPDRRAPGANGLGGTQGKGGGGRRPPPPRLSRRGRLLLAVAVPAVAAL